MAKHTDTTVIYSKRPANFPGNPWLDAFVAGSGRVGAAILGAYSNEAILVGHTALKHRGYTGVLQDVSDKYPNVRKLYNDAKVHEAERLLAGEFEKRSYKPKPDQPMPLCILNLDFKHDGVVSDYARTIDMADAEVSVEFKVPGTSYERNLTVGRTTDTIAYYAHKTGTGKINLNISLDTLCNRYQHKSEIPQNCVAKFEGGYITFAARVPGGAEYGLVARIIVAGGNAKMTPDSVQITDADNVTIFAKPYVGGTRDTQAKTLKNELAGIKLNYTKFATANASVHRRVWGESGLELQSQHDAGTDMCTLIGMTGDALLPPALIERMWNFAKYLVICCDGGVMTPDGLWGADTECTNSHITFNNRAQLLYGGTTQTASPDVILNFFTYFDKYQEDLKKNAARVYGAKGFFVPDCFSPESALFGAVDAQTLHFVASSALAANLFYNYYLVTGDTKTLKSKIFPFMREVLGFYSDILKLDNNGFYTTIPSYSPDATPGNTIGGKPLNNFAFAVNSTIDFLAIGTLIDNLLHASQVLGSGATESQVWRDMKTKLPAFQVGSTGGIREYTNSAFIDGTVNRGCMHSYGLYPLKTFSFADQIVPYKPEVSTQPDNVISLRTASANAIVNRLATSGHIQNSNVLAMYAAQMAHANEPTAVRNLLLRLVASSFTPSGLALSNDWRGSGWTNNNAPRLDICSNLGFATAVTECVLQSNPTTLRILPTVFSEISAGRVQDIATEFGATVTMEWSVPRSKLTMKINPKQNAVVTIDFNPEFRKLRHKELRLDSDNQLKNFKLSAGKPVVLEF